MSLAAQRAYCLFYPAPAGSARPEASCQSQVSGPRPWRVKRGQKLGQEGPGAQGLLRLLERRPRSVGPGGSARGCVPCCGVARPVRASLDPLIFSACAPPFGAHSESLGFAGRVSPPRVFFMPRISVLVSRTWIRSSVELSSALPNAQLNVVCTCIAVVFKLDIGLAFSLAFRPTSFPIFRAFFFFPLLYFLKLTCEYTAYPSLKLLILQASITNNSPDLLDRLTELGRWLCFLVRCRRFVEPLAQSVLQQ